MSNLFSPGVALSERANIEVGLSRFMNREVSAFLVRTEVLALAAPASFSRGLVDGQWSQVVSDATVYAASVLGVTYEDIWRNDFLRGFQRRMQLNSLPGQVYSTVTSVMASNPTAAALGEALSLDTPSSTLVAGLGVIGRLWRSLVDFFVRSESTAMKNTEMMFKLVEKGIAEKRWVAHHDEKTRATHRAIDGTTQILNRPFLVGGYPMQYPGDPAGPISELANCRCVIVGVKL